MIFTEYLESVENTEQEPRLIELISKHKNDFAQAARVPLAGKPINALIALGDCGSIEAFKKSEFYRDIEGWDVYINLDSGHISMYPGAKTRKKIFKALAIVGVGAFSLWLYRGYRRKHAKWPLPLNARQINSWIGSRFS